MRQQEKLEGRVVNIDERLAKLESDKTVMKVGGAHGKTTGSELGRLSKCLFH